MLRLSTSILLFLLFVPACLAETFGPFQILESEPVDALWINAGFLSYHFQTDKNLNNSNLGGGVEYRSSSVQGVAIGSFLNSNRQTSHYATWYWQPLALGIVKFGAALGGLDGYPKMRNGDWFLAIIPIASIEYERVGLNMTVIPNYKDKLYGALSFQLKVKIN